MSTENKRTEDARGFADFLGIINPGREKPGLGGVTERVAALRSLLQKTEGELGCSLIRETKDTPDPRIEFMMDGSTFIMDNRAFCSKVTKRQQPINDSSGSHPIVITNEVSITIEQFTNAYKDAINKQIEAANSAHIRLDIAQGKLFPQK